jgi:hypothetical protein
MVWLTLIPVVLSLAGLVGLLVLTGTAAERDGRRSERLAMQIEAAERGLAKWTVDARGQTAWRWKSTSELLTDEVAETVKNPPNKESLDANPR